MDAPSRKIRAVFLLVPVLAPLIFMFAFQVKQAAIQHRMKKKMEDQLLRVLVLDKNNIQWFKPGREIMINDRLFDVKHIEYFPDGTARLTGLYDDEETLLVQQLKHNRDERNQNMSRQLISALLQWQGIPEDTHTEFIPLAWLNHYPSFSDPGLAAPFIAMITPPPQA